MFVAGLSEPSGLDSLDLVVLLQTSGAAMYDHDFSNAIMPVQDTAAALKSGADPAEVVALLKKKYALSAGEAQEMVQRTQRALYDPNYATTPAWVIALGRLLSGRTRTPRDSIEGGVVAPHNALPRSDPMHDVPNKTRSTLDTNQVPTIAEDLRGATFWRRFLAFIVDYVIVIAAFVVAYSVGFWIAGTVAGSVFGFSLPLVYLGIGNAYGGPIGKRLLGIRVVHTVDRRHLGLIRGFVRGAVFLVTPFVGWLWLAFDKGGQAIHDHAVNSAVVERVKSPR